MPAPISKPADTCGFGFLDEHRRLRHQPVADPLQRADTYGRVFFVGLLNTLLVSALGIVLATILGFVIGIARLSPNWLLARLAGGYVELIRNLPLLFQILFWYLAVLGDAGAAPEHRDRLQPLLRASRGICISRALRRAGRHRAVVARPGGMDRPAGGLSQQPRPDHAGADLRRGHGNRRGRAS